MNVQKPEASADNVKLKQYLNDAIADANDEYVAATGDKKPDAIINEILKRRNVLINIYNICRNRKKF